MVEGVTARLEGYAMRVTVTVHGTLCKIASVCNGPVEVESGASVRDLLCLIGLTGVEPALTVMNGRVVAADDLLSEGASISVFPRVSGG